MQPTRATPQNDIFVCPGTTRRFRLKSGDSPASILARGFRRRTHGATVWATAATANLVRGSLPLGHAVLVERVGTRQNDHHVVFLEIREANNAQGTQLPRFPLDTREGLLGWQGRRLWLRGKFVVVPRDQVPHLDEIAELPDHNQKDLVIRTEFGNIASFDDGEWKQSAMFTESTDSTTPSKPVITNKAGVPKRRAHRSPNRRRGQPETPTTATPSRRNVRISVAAAPVRATREMQDAEGGMTCRAKDHVAVLTSAAAASASTKHGRTQPRSRIALPERQRQSRRARAAADRLCAAGCATGTAHLASRSSG
eukprot:CAMPEP_0198505982 /NCGR_PEP_ID=MMETSP1462-20131121/11374_1 /TAXON_ID=1333877 /ORGANISM="Brandtodinium nutriculum, Strain RCC3387" /LENGTH=310 /DNA_ID=CAMNT_0044235183 /DNA_START=213 /DNA_END=1143 /DNA_ORIENTATION=-